MVEMFYVLEDLVQIVAGDIRHVREIRELSPFARINIRRTGADCENGAWRNPAERNETIPDEAAKRSTCER
jgi:hypothetical protein